MFNINKINTVYLACGVTDLRKSIDGLVMIVQNEMKLDPFDNVLFVFCNKQMNKLKILHFDEGFWLHYYRLDDYQKTRASSCPKEFLKGFSGFLQTDGYQGYNKVENVKRVYCLAHIRRKFHEIVSNLSDEALKNARAIIGFNYCEQIYKLEKDIKSQYGKDKDYYQKRYEIRLNKLAPILEEFEKYINIEIENALPKSPLGKALEYAQKTVPIMKNILEDGSLEIDNNAAERAIKPFVIGRKNWLFSNTAKGARASATIYSIIETAKANKLKIEMYLCYLFDNISNMEFRDKDSLLKLMPWSNTIPKELKLKSSK